jgi:hypothetical protein
MHSDHIFKKRTSYHYFGSTAGPERQHQCQISGTHPTHNSGAPRRCSNRCCSCDKPPVTTICHHCITSGQRIHEVYPRGTPSIKLWTQRLPSSTYQALRSHLPRLWPLRTSGTSGQTTSALGVGCYPLASHLPMLLPSRIVPC